MLGARGDARERPDGLTPGPPACDDVTRLPVQRLPLMVNVIAAAVISGTSLFGGRGSVWSALPGALVIGSIQSGMNIMGVSNAVHS